MRNLLFIIVSLILLAGCEEVGPVINLEGDGSVEGLTDTTYVSGSIESPQAKVVLIDEFTGVKCNNCPLGHELTIDLETQNPGRIIAVSYHSLFLADPFPYSTQDLREEEAESFAGLFGIPGAKPLAMIDRKLFTGETNIYHFRAKWSSFATSQIANETTPVNIDLEKSYNPTDRKLRITMKLHYTEAVATPNKYTILLAENDIVTAQTLPDQSIDTNYVHKEVFRGFITPISGSPINVPLEAGRTIIKEFETTLDPIWNADHIEIVAFVHETGNSDEVYHAAKVEVKD